MTWRFLFFHVIYNSVPAHFIEKFSLLSVRKGQTARLSCGAYGTRPISIKWFRQNPTTGQLILLPVTPDTTSVISHPQDDLSQSDVSKSGQSTSHHSSSRSNNNYRYHQHQHHSSSSPSSFGVFYTSFERLTAFQINYPNRGDSDSDERTVFELFITSTQLNDSGLYVCKTSNEFGDDTHNSELTILGLFTLHLSSLSPPPLSLPLSIPSLFQTNNHFIPFIHSFHWILSF